MEQKNAKRSGFLGLFGKKQKRSASASGKAQQKFGGDLDFAAKEAYNLLRTNLSFSFPNRTRGILLGTTSPNPQEGKSFTSINLAYSLAKDGMKVLLIDSDMRKPSIGDKLGLKTAPGLSNYLIKKDESIIHEGILHENLSMLMAGNIPPNPSELIGSENMKNVLDAFAEKYDYVIVDLPPVNSVSDPLVMSRYLDGIVVVIKHDYSRQKDVEEAIRQLKFVKAHILGFVYNGYVPEGGRSYYRKGSKYYKKDYRSYGASSEKRAGSSAKAEEPKQADK